MLLKLFPMVPNVIEHKAISRAAVEWLFFEIPSGFFRVERRYFSSSVWERKATLSNEKGNKTFHITGSVTFSLKQQQKVSF